MLKTVKKIDQWLSSHLYVLILLLLLVILRLPNFFEPYWYGDEGIYLTIGNAIRGGEKLYTDIVDHKTPIIYYLAAVPNQLSFRFLTNAWMMIATIAFYKIAKKLFKNKLSIGISLFLFVFLTSVPWLEGNIPNGELFVMGFVLVGGWILSRTKIFASFLQTKKPLAKLQQPLNFYLTGVLFGLGILTKVPGLLDVVGWLAIFWFLITNKFNSKDIKQWSKTLLTNLKYLGLVLLGIITPILLSIIYFITVGSGQDYLEFGLLYNFHYAANWNLPFNNGYLVMLFTLQGKIIIAAIIFAILTFRKKYFTPAQQLIFGWFILSLVGALLSNRPYPHYFQQVVPAFAFLIGNLCDIFFNHQKKNSKSTYAQFTMALILLGLAVGSLKLLNFGAYPLKTYYQKFYQLVSGQITREEYNQSFNHLMKDNYQAAEIINQSGVDEIFIWGTNPILYALTQTNPTGRFTVSFHIKDLKVYQETMESVMNKEPLFVVIMNDEYEELPGLNEYLSEYYVLNANFENFALWKRLPELVSLGTL